MYKLIQNQLKKTQMKKFKSFFYASACMAAAVFAYSFDKEPQNGRGSDILL